MNSLSWSGGRLTVGRSVDENGCEIMDHMECKPEAEMEWECLKVKVNSLKFWGLAYFHFGADV